jgi:hypothetical protein
VHSHCEWQNGKRHGKGVCTYGDGATYDGEWQDNKRHGKGVMTYPNGAKYGGSWQHDKEHDDCAAFYPACGSAPFTGRYRDGQHVHGQC